MNPYSTWSIDALRGFVASSESFIASDVHDSLKEMYRKRIDLVKQEIDRRSFSENNETKDDTKQKE